MTNFSATLRKSLESVLLAPRLKPEAPTSTEKNYDVLTPEKGVPIKAWVKGVPLEEQARQQLLNVAQLPFIFKWVAAMPDVHWGIGATVGSVIPTTPPLDAEYAACPICPSNAATEAVLTMTPLSPSALGSFFEITQAARRATLNVPIKFTRMTFVNRARSAGPSFPIILCGSPIRARPA